MSASAQQIQAALAAFPSAPLAEGGRALLAALGFASRRTLEAGSGPDDFRAVFDRNHALNPERACLARWKSWAFLFQLTNQEIPALAMSLPLDAGAGGADREQIESMLFLAVDLESGRDSPWRRTQLAAITREMNRCTAMPAIILFRTGGTASLAVIERRASLREPEKDVLGSRVSIIRDINCLHPHRGQLQILEDLAKTRQRGAEGFSGLYGAWLDTLKIETLNRNFYTQLASWFLWARGVVEFPPGQPADSNEKGERRQSVAVIRLLTRLIFVWFLKEKGLVPDDLFDPTVLRSLLRKDPAENENDSGYYKAILQNLFFATLNTAQAERGWRGKAASEYFDPRCWRHKNLLANPDAVERLFRSIPFLNGGLFDCLDRDLSDRDFGREPGLRARASKEGRGWILRVDGFSGRGDVHLTVPNCIFFAQPFDFDLTGELETRRLSRIQGLVHLFGSFKFTVEENTPLDQDVALDPELLGRVFENLLASYNPDTKVQARKKSGSFYTPREVVNFMVAESLVAYFQRRLGWAGDAKREARLRELLDWKPKDKDLFSAAEAEQLVAAIEDLRALDPACGSGAFPMGLLEHLVQALRHLDPENKLWRKSVRKRLEKILEDAHDIAIEKTRDEQVASATEALQNFDRDFADPRRLDYSRKLHLIGNCLYGVDIQPVAVQIAKLRFFISLVVAQQPSGDANSNFGITPLPNLEMRLIAANSLRELDAAHHQQALRSGAILEAERSLRRACSRYYSAGSVSQKRKLRREIDALRDAFINLLRTEALLDTTDADALARWDPFDQNAHAGFFDAEWMFQVTRGFDLVIGNPPYVRQEAIDRGDKLFLTSRYECATGTADLYVYFYERGVNLLCPDGGLLAYISSNKWLRSGYGKKLRTWLPKQTKMLWTIDFGDQPVFDATAYPGVFIVQRRPPPDHRTAFTGDGNVRAYNWPEGVDFGPESFPSLPLRDYFAVPQADLDGGAGWHLEVADKRDLLTRLQSTGVTLTQFCGGKIYYGIKTGFNKAFVISGAERAQLIAEDPRSEEIIKPFLAGRDIKRWRAQARDQWLIKIESSENRSHAWSESASEPAAARAFADMWPAIAKRILGMRDKLRTRTDRGRFYWELRSCDYWRDFEKPKIIYPDISVGPSFAWDETGSYVGNTVYFLPGAQPWLCALLNSPPLDWVYTKTASAIRGGYRRAFSSFIGALPVPQAAPAARERLSEISRMLAAASEPHLEQLANALVYEMFFPEELRAQGLRFADELGAPGIDAAALARRCANPDDRLGKMLLDLQSLEVVRIIED